MLVPSRTQNFIDPIITTRLTLYSQFWIYGAKSQRSPLENISSDKEQGETAVFTGYWSFYLLGNIMFLNKRQEEKIAKEKINFC